MRHEKFEKCSTHHPQTQPQKPETRNENLKRGSDVSAACHRPSPRSPAVAPAPPLPTRVCACLLRRQAAAAKRAAARSMRAAACTFRATPSAATSAWPRRSALTRRCATSRRAAISKTPTRDTWAAAPPGGWQRSSAASAANPMSGGQLRLAGAMLNVSDTPPRSEGVGGWGILAAAGTGRPRLERRACRF